MQTPNATKPEGETALMTAARSGNVAVVQALLAHGARVDAVEQWRGQTALMWAAAENNADVVRALVKAGAAVDARSKAGFTALLFAARAGQIDSARALLEAGADVNETLPDGMASLTLAVVNARYEFAAFLLDYGADPNADGPGWTALHQLAWTRRPHVGFNNPDPVQMDSFDSLELVRKMIAYGADPNLRMKKELKEVPRTGLSGLNRTGATPFFLAAKDCDVALMRVLAENGADPLQTNADNSTPLMVAAGVGIFTPGEDPGHQRGSARGGQAGAEPGRKHHRRRRQGRDGSARRRGARRQRAGAVSRRPGRPARQQESERLDAADHRGGRRDRRHLQTAARDGRPAAPTDGSLRGSRRDPADAALNRFR